MKIAEIVEKTIDRLPFGYVFTYDDFKIDVRNKASVLKHLGRMALGGRVVKLSKGKYYKPEISRFGQVLVSTYQLVKDLLEKDGKAIGYITGYAAYNELLLTTQVPSAIQIGANENTNGLIRQYIPKGTDFSEVTDKQIKRIENILNNRPCKRLGFLTPNEKFKQLLTLNSVAFAG